MKHLNFFNMSKKECIDILKQHLLSYLMLQECMSKSGYDLDFMPLRSALHDYIKVIKSA